MNTFITMPEVKTLKEIEKEVGEPKYDYIEKYATISDDKKSLLIRIPAEIRDHIKMKQGEKIRFKVRADNKNLEIKYIKNVNG